MLHINYKNALEILVQLNFQNYPFLNVNIAPSKGVFGRALNPRLTIIILNLALQTY